MAGFGGLFDANPSHQPLSKPLIKDDLHFLVFFEIPFFPASTDLFFELFPFLSRDFRGFGGGKESLFFGVVLPFSKKKLGKEGQGRGGGCLKEGSAYKIPAA